MAERGDYTFFFLLIIFILLTLLHYKSPFTTNITWVDDLFETTDRIWDAIFFPKTPAIPGPAPIIEPTYIVNFTVGISTGGI